MITYMRCAKLEEQKQVSQSMTLSSSLIRKASSHPTNRRLHLCVGRRERGCDSRGKTNHSQGERSLRKKNNSDLMPLDFSTVIV